MLKRVYQNSVNRSATDIDRYLIQVENCLLHSETNAGRCEELRHILDGMVKGHQISKLFAADVLNTYVDCTAGDLMRNHGYYFKREPKSDFIDLPVSVFCDPSNTLITGRYYISVGGLNFFMYREDE